MYKKVTNLLLSLLIIVASIQGFYLFKTIQQNKIQTTTIQATYKHQIQSLKQVVGNYVQQVDRVDKQLRENEVKIQPTILTEDVVEKARKATVTLRTTSPISAYTTHTNSGGSGCIIDKDQGLIMTNAHVVGRATIGKYEVQFFNGNLADAKLVYCDEWLDIAILQVEPKEIPQETIATKLSTKEPEIGEPIFMVGYNEGNSHSTHTGRISSLEKIVQGTGEYTNLPNGSIVYSMNNQGGSSGSGVFNQKGDIVALHYSGSNTFGNGVHLQYLQYILPFIQKNKQPLRKHIGVITQLFPLADVVKYSGLSKEQIEHYRKQLPRTTQNLITVNSVLKGTPAEGKLVSGDIIFAINNQIIGANLARFDLIMSRTNKPSITLDILRQGKIMQIKIDLYDINQHKIKKMVAFGGAIFFEADDCWTNNTTIPTRTLTFYKIEKGQSFDTSKYFGYRKFHGQVTALNNIPVTNLDELIALIPKLVTKKNFSMNYITPWQRKYMSLIDYNHLDPTPIIYTYNPETLTWDIEKIDL